MYFDRDTWRLIRLVYNFYLPTNRIFFFLSSRNNNVPWVFSRYRLKLFVYQNNEPWIVPLKPYQYGFKTGELGRTRVISRHGRKKKKKK